MFKRGEGCTYNVSLPVDLHTGQQLSISSPAFSAPQPLTADVAIALSFVVLQGKMAEEKKAVPASAQAGPARAECEYVSLPLLFFFLHVVFFRALCLGVSTVDGGPQYANVAPLAHASSLFLSVPPSPCPLISLRSHRAPCPSFHRPTVRVVLHAASAPFSRVVGISLNNSYGIASQLKKFYLNPALSDMDIVVGDQKLPCHRFLVATSSAVLGAMIFPHKDLPEHPKVTKRYKIL